MIALRATRQAMRIAADLAYKPIDPEEVPCVSCGRDVREEAVWHDFTIRCPACGALTELPVHLRSRYLLPPEDRVGDRVSVRISTPLERAFLMLVTAFAIAVVAVFVIAIFKG